jgi:hypothetical protein
MREELTNSYVIWMFLFPSPRRALASLASDVWNTEDTNMVRVMNRSPTDRDFLLWMISVLATLDYTKGTSRDGCSQFLCSHRATLQWLALMVFVVTLSLVILFSDRLYRLFGLGAVGMYWVVLRGVACFTFVYGLWKYAVL